MRRSLDVKRLNETPVLSIEMIQLSFKIWIVLISYLPKSVRVRYNLIYLDLLDRLGNIEDGLYVVILQYNYKLRDTDLPISKRTTKKKAVSCNKQKTVYFFNF